MDDLFATTLMALAFIATVLMALGALISDDH